MQDYYQRSRDYSSPYEDVLNNGRRSYNFSNMQKSIQLSETDKRIEQIKRKYDTPNRKDRISQLSAKKYDLSNKENQNYGTADFKTKISSIPIQTEGSEQGMKESKAISNSRQTFFNNPSSTPKSYMPTQMPRQRESYDPKLNSNKLYTNENEEEFFKRVKEMKQSLLYGDNPTKQQPEMRSSTFYPIRQSRARSGFYDSNQTIEKDRIDNIDKINQKIKGILECLNENEKTRIPSRADNNKRSKADILGNNDQEINAREVARTPVKNVITSSIMGRESFGPQRHQRSQILDKIQINRQFREQPRKIETKKTQDDDKWQKLSSKLQKYELENKLRYQKAYDFSKEVEKQVSAPTNTQSIVDNIRKQRTSYQEPTDIKRSTEFVRRDNRSTDARDIRSRSFLNPQTSIKETRDRSLYSRDLTGQKDYEMKSGKKLDDEIGRLQKKIQQFEEEKKRLGVNFKPFSYSNTKSTSNLFMNNTRTELPKNDYSERKISDFKGGNIRNQSSFNCKPKQNLNQQFNKLENQETFREKKDYCELQSFHDNSFNRLDSKIEIKLEKSNPSSVRTSKFISHDSSNEKEEQQESFRLDQQTKPAQQQQKSYERSYKYHMDESLKKHTDQGIEQRRRKLMGMENQESRCDNGELKTLVKSLCDQVQLDEDFRNAKIWFECIPDSKKEEEVKKLLPNKSIEQIREIFNVRESQNNPFFTTQGYDSSYSTLVDLYKKSESHWNQTIYKRYNKGSLESQGFTSKDIDLEKKGHINLGDLVRFLNLESGTFYRNRDLSLVFIRIAKQYKGQSHTEVSFSQMMETFCR